MMMHVKVSAVAAAAVMAAVAACAIPAHAQSERLSLAERVDRLEHQTSAQSDNGGAVGLVNQISALQSQVQSLQGQVEELKHELDESKQRSKDQYIDLDSRMGRLEGNGAGAARPAAAPRDLPRNSQPPDVDLSEPARNPPPRAAENNGENVGDLTAADRAAGAQAPADGDDLDPRSARDNPAAANPAAETAAYNEAFAALKDGRYAESARRFQAFIDQYPDGPLTGNAYYWLGESYYVTQNYTIAQQSFQTLLTRYPDSQKAPDALLKVGYSQYELKQWDAAESTLNQVVQTYPDTTVARLAQGRLRALKMETRH